MTKRKLTKIGTSTGAILPNAMLTRLKVKEGDALYTIETKERYLITPYDPAIADQFEAGGAFMKEYRKPFEALAQ